MKDNHNIKQKVEKTLDSLNGVTRAKCNPFLAAKVLQRLEGNSQATPFRFQLQNPTFLLGFCTILVVVLNFTFFYFTWKKAHIVEIQPAITSVSTPENDQNAAKWENFARDYALETPVYPN